MGSTTLSFILTKDPKLVTMVEDMFGPVLTLGATVHGLALDLGKPCEFVAVCDPGQWTVNAQMVEQRTVIGVQSQRTPGNSLRDLIWRSRMDRKECFVGERRSVTQAVDTSSSFITSSKVPFGPPSKGFRLASAVRRVRDSTQ